MPTTDADGVECIDCGDRVDSDEAIYSSSGFKENGLSRLVVEEEPVDADELFGFEDGPYCSLACSMQPTADCDQGGFNA